jgi:hypothetical protein
MFLYHDLPALSVVPVQNAQDLVDPRVGIEAHAAIVDDDK